MRKRVYQSNSVGDGYSSEVHTWLMDNSSHDHYPTSGLVNPMVMNAIGFTGTRYGMSRIQRDVVGDILCELRLKLKCEEFHHGCCVGADSESAALARDLGYILVGHPASGTGSLRAMFRSDKEYRPLSPLRRNKIIVESVMLMIAAPFSTEAGQRGGTWYTVRYARKQEKPLMIVYRDGSTVEENCEPLAG